VRNLRPDLLMVSGDLVEHATQTEFEQARDFLKRLPYPQIVVPGNHDLPFYDPVRRVAQRLSYYRRFITNNCDPLFEDSEIAVTGIATPRVFPLKGGRISAAQVRRIQSRTCNLPSSVVRVLVTHHPLDLPELFRARQLAHRALRAVEALSPCIDLMLAGHLHLSSVGATAVRYPNTGHSVVFAQAGTATSRRNKGEPNSFNVIRIEQSRISIQRQTWSDAQRDYQPSEWETFCDGERGWARQI
jgi:3',5'-cyclic AMP phosphodiesterase CpdA